MSDIVIVMGPSSCGKSTLGMSLADAAGMAFIEGDHFHPPGNLDKMRRGQPLTDDDRAGWLRSLCDEMNRCTMQHKPVVLSCSALKKQYRNLFRAVLNTAPVFIYLEISEELAKERCKARAGHFMPEVLIRSQFQTLEPPKAESDVLVVPAEWNQERQVTFCLHELNLQQAINS